MKVKQFTKVGRITKSQGLDGAVKVILNAPYEDIYNHFDHLFIWEEGQMLPLFIDTVEMDGSGQLQIIFEDIDNPQDAANLSAREIFQDTARLGLLGHYAEVQQNLEELTSLQGLLIIDPQLSTQVKIEEIIEYPHQLMAVIQYNDQERLLPLDRSFIVSIDREKGTVNTQFPEGLFDL